MRLKDKRDKKKVKREKMKNPVITRDEAKRNNEETKNNKKTVIARLPMQSEVEAISDKFSNCFFIQEIASVPICYRDFAMTEIFSIYKFCCHFEP